MLNAWVSGPSAESVGKPQKRATLTEDVHLADVTSALNRPAPKRFRRNQVPCSPECSPECSPISPKSADRLHTLANAAIEDQHSARLRVHRTSLARNKRVSFVTPSKDASTRSVPMVNNLGHETTYTVDTDPEIAPKGSRLSAEFEKQFFVDEHQLPDVNGEQLQYYRSRNDDPLLQLCHLFALGVSLFVRGTPLCPCHGEPLLRVVRAPFKCPFNQEQTAKKRVAKVLAARQSAKKPGETHPLTCKHVLRYWPARALYCCLCLLWGGVTLLGIYFI